MPNKENFAQGSREQAAHSRMTAIYLAVFVLSVLGFSILAWAVTAGKTFWLDQRVVLGFRSPEGLSELIGPKWLEYWALNFTALGSASILVFLVAAAAGAFLFQRKLHSAGLLLAAVGGGQIMSTSLKAGFDRVRPPLALHETYVYGSSFPSGHTTMATIAYFVLAFMLARNQERFGFRVYLFALAGFLAVSVGFTRVYLGVHWPTDVLAGWLAALAWLSICRLLVRQPAENPHVQAPDSDSEAR